MVPVVADPLTPGEVLIHEGRVLAVGDDLTARHPDVPVEDLGAAILAPGFVDVHCHLEWSLAAGMAPEDGGFGPWLAGLISAPRPTAAGHEVAALAGAVSALCAGTTMLLDSGPTGGAVAALAATGQRGVVHIESFNADPATARQRAEVTAATMAALAATAPPRVRVGVSPHAPYSAGPELWHALAEVLPAGSSFATHVAESAEEALCLDDGHDGPLARAAARAGVSLARWPGSGGPVRRLAQAGVLRPGVVAAHCVQVDEHDARLLAETGTVVAHCPISNGRLSCGRSPLELLRAAGVHVGLGTDSPASAGDYDLRAEARACAVLQGAGGHPQNAERLVRMMTSDGAVVAGRPDLGRIAAGCPADLVAVTPAPEALPGDPYVGLLDPRARVTDVWVDGERLLDGGRPVRLDAGDVRAAAAEVRRGLC